MTDDLPTTASASSAMPTPITRLLEQSIAEQEKTRARLEAHIEVATLRFESFENQRRADFLSLRRDITELSEHVGAIEEHVSFLTKKVVDHDKRFDTIDARLNDHDKRFEDIDARFDAVDSRLDAHDKRFDKIDVRFDALTDLTLQIRDAVLPPKE